jgi:hypothetical protein
MVNWVGAKITAEKFRNAVKAAGWSLSGGQRLRRRTEDPPKGSGESAPIRSYQEVSYTLDLIWSYTLDLIWSPLEYGFKNNPGELPLFI